MRLHALSLAALTGLALSLSACGFDFESRRKAHEAAQAEANARARAEWEAKRAEELGSYTRIYSVAGVNTLTLVGGGPRVVRLEAMSSSPGWTDPMARRVEGDDNSDGILEIEIVGRPPKVPVPGKITSILIEYQLSTEEAALQTVRVHTASGVEEASLHPVAHPIPE